MLSGLRDVTKEISKWNIVRFCANHPSIRLTLIEVVTRFQKLACIILSNTPRIEGKGQKGKRFAAVKQKGLPVIATGFASRRCR